MNHWEINVSLAIAIGYSICDIWIADDKVIVPHAGSRIKVCGRWHDGREFDYRDWDVVGPIADKLIVSLIRCENYTSTYWEAIHGMSYDDNHSISIARTPQEAIALAVIGGKK